MPAKNVIMQPPTVAKDLQAWLEKVAVPFARHALSGIKGDGWVSTSAWHTHNGHNNGYTSHTVVYNGARESWSVDRAPYTAHGKMAMLSYKSAFEAGWQALVEALYERYQIVGVGMVLEFVEGDPYVEFQATFPGAKRPKASVAALEKGCALPSLDAFIGAFEHMDSRLHSGEKSKNTTI